MKKLFLNLLPIVLNSLPAIIFTIVLLPASQYALGRTVTDENDVVYDVIDETKMLVSVSKNNNSMFRDRKVAITIPTEVYNTATTSGYSDGPYSVARMEQEAFQYTSITSITINAPIPQIPAYTFRGCENLTKVELPNTVTELQSEAFKGCTSLNDISDISNVTMISTYAFQNCTGLEHINLPEGLLTISNYAFSGCTTLDNVTIPSSVKTIPFRGFELCTGLKNITLNSGLTSISTYAFSECTNLKFPSLPSTVNYIGERAFTKCYNLGVVTLIEGLSLEHHAFMESGIDKIIWPKNALKEIRYSAFEGVVTLKSLTIPGWLATMPDRMFAECPDLEELKFEEGVDLVGLRTFYHCAKLKRVDFCESLNTIKMEAFWNCASLTDFDFPSKMVLISKGAFHSCSSLSDVTLPAEASMESDVFANCKLNSITFPDTAMGTFSNAPFGQQTEITTMHFPSWMETLPSSVCYTWGKLEKVTFEEGIKAIGASAFTGANLLTEITLPASLETIGANAFINNSMLQSIKYADFDNSHLTTIETSAFSSCSNLAAIEFPASLRNINNQAFYRCKALESVKFNAGMTEIGARAFWECTALKEVLLPSTLEKIGERAFASCTSLPQIDFPASLTTIDGWAFNSCNALTSVTLHAGMNIGEYAFYNCPNIKSINLPDEPVNFGTYVFGVNHAITEFSFPLWMTVIPSGFCYQWSALKTINLHEGIIEISDQVFYYDQALHNVKYPDSLKKIGKLAFFHCTYNAQKRDENGQYVKDETGAIIWEYFGEVLLPDEIYVDDNAFAESTVTKISFKGCAEFGADCFRKLSKISEFEFPTCIKEIPDGFCNNWETLTKVVIPADCTKIGANAFYNDTKLVSLTYRGYEPEEGETPAMVVLPESIMEIGDCAFKFTNLTEIPWPDHPITIGEGCFYGTKIEHLEIPAWMAEVPKQCFFSCHELKELTYEPRNSDDAVKTLTFGESSIAYCDKLEKITFPEVPVVLGVACFQNCNKATEIKWNKAGITLGRNSFSSCSSLQEITIPDYINIIPYACFQSTSGVKKVDLGPNVETIEDYAFNSCGVEEIVWSPTLKTLGNQSFSSTGFVKLKTPGTVKKIPYFCFSSCQKLEELEIAEGTEQISEGGVYQCKQLRKLTTPTTLYDIGYRSFHGAGYDSEYDTEIHFAEGLKTIAMWAFMDAANIRTLELPSTLTSIGVRAFCRNYKLEEVLNHGEGLTLNTYAFENCTHLTTFTSDGHISTIQDYCFANLASLTDFFYTAEKPIGDIGYNVFDNCTSLRTFPHLGSGYIRDNAFHNCSSLREFYMPTSGDFYRNIQYANPSKYLEGASALESIVFPTEGDVVKIKAIDLGGAPLRALSYCYASDIKIPGGGLTERSIAEYVPHDDYPDPAEGETKPILMVNRGERWKFVEAGYSKKFDIREMKQPQINIQGNIWSKYNSETKRNVYSAYLRWSVPLSDLNWNGKTEATIYRDDKPIGEIVFSQPYVPETIPEDISAEEVIAVDVTLNGQPNPFKGDFVFYDTDENGKESYHQIMMYESETMYFDAKSHKRLVTFDKYGFDSWFVMVDEFESPEVDGNEPMPTEYSYRATLKGYEYYTYENNTNLEEKDGLLYHEVYNNPEKFETEAVVMHTAMAEPKLNFAGLYTKKDIEDDRDAGLAPTLPHSQRRDKTYNLSFKLDPYILSLYGRDELDVNDKPVIQAVNIYDVTDGDPKLLTTYNLPNRNGDYSVRIPTVDGIAPEPGRSYQISQSSKFLGEFGSAIVTIPEAPTVVTEPLVRHLRENDHIFMDEAVIQGKLDIYPDATGLYGEAMPTGHYHIGIWRNVEASRSGAPAMAAATDQPAGELVYHIEGEPAGKLTACECDDCKLANGMEVKDSAETPMMTYTENYSVPWWHEHNVTYTTRYYVEVPAETVGEESQWMVAEHKITTSNGIVTSVENPEYDISEEDAKYFDMQGRQIASPTPGQPCIMVTPTGTRKIYN